MRFVPKVILASILFLFPAFSSPAIAADDRKPLFAGDGVISMTLSGPLEGLSRKPGAGSAPGLLRLDAAASESLPVQLTTRGVTRLRKDVCDFPPLRVEFSAKPGKASLFRGQKQLKLVTHCQLAEKYEQYVLLEYAAYRLYGALTPQSFGARLARINYVGESGRPIATRMGFFIEDIDDVAHRNGQERLRGIGRIASTQLDPDAAARFAVFQYMISNLDWAMTLASPGEEDCCHNSRLVGRKGATAGLITVPYDFDFAGLVDAPYAAPPANAGVANVRIRQYRGFCRYNAQAQSFAAALAPRRAELLALFDRTPQLSERSRERGARYLGEFFDQIASPSGIAAVLKTCLG